MGFCSDVIRIGIVGCGMISKYHARAIAETDGIVLAGCCSRSPETARAFAEEFSVTVYDSFADMLAAPGIDAAAICTPSGDHAGQILAALDAGKHVIVEKPMCLTLEEADQIAAKSAGSHLTVCVISQSRFSDAAMAVRNALDTGCFGKMVSASLRMRYYRSQAYYDQAGWRGTAAGDGGGVLMNQGIHGIDLLCSFLGTPVNVCGYTAARLRNIEVEDTAVASVLFESGAMASIDATVCEKPALPRKLILCGENGSVTLEEDTITDWSLPAPCPLPAGGQDNRQTSGGSGAADPSGITHHNHAREYADFVRSVRTGTPPLVDAIQGRIPLTVIHGIYESSGSGKKIELENPAVTPAAVPAANPTDPATTPATDPAGPADPAVTPVRLDSPRAWRTYLGGSLLDELHGKKGGENGHFPEEWIMSVVAARNAGREHIPDEGMSRLPGTGKTLKEYLSDHAAQCLGAGHVKAYGTSTGVLAKLIDSAERLTIQVHPDNAAAMELFQSPFGKTECWHILGGRRVNGEEPCIYLGFRPDITREYWKHLFDVQDIQGMLNAMHKFPVKPGDTILIKGGMPHAIGAGCFLAEIQEPTDFTIRVERTTPSGFPVDDFLCHQGLGYPAGEEPPEPSSATAPRLCSAWTRSQCQKNFPSRMPGNSPACMCWMAPAS